MMKSHGIVIHCMNFHWKPWTEGLELGWPIPQRMGKAITTDRVGGPVNKPTLRHKLPVRIQLKEDQWRHAASGMGCTLRLLGETLLRAQPEGQLVATPTLQWPTASSEENKGEIWCWGLILHERLLLFKHQDHLVHSEIRMQEILGKQPREKDSSIPCEAYSRYYLSRNFDLFIKMMSESLDC